MELSEEARLQRAQTFDQIAGLYDRGRREPPGWLYDAVFAGSRLDMETARVLEIGCGHDAMIIKPRELAALLVSPHCQ